MTLLYQHEDSTTKVITAALADGMVAQFNFTTGVATVTYNGAQSQLPLSQVMLLATKNDQNAANALYSQLSTALGAPHAGRLTMLHTGAVSTNIMGVNRPTLLSRASPRPMMINGGPGSYSGIGNCGDVEDAFCFSGIDGDFGGGAYNMTWGADGGGCTSVVCQIWQARQQDACSQETDDTMMVLVGDAAVVAGCFPTESVPTLGATCAAGILSYVAAVHHGAANVAICATPYSGP